jgi:hypothetical protein
MQALLLKRNRILPHGPLFGRDRIKAFVAELALTKTASAVLSYEFAHAHELSGAVPSEEPDNILFRVSDKRPVRDDSVSLRLAGMQYEVRAFFGGRYVQQTRALSTRTVKRSDLASLQQFSLLANRDRATDHKRKPLYEAGMIQ